MSDPFVVSATDAIRQVMGFYEAEISVSEDPETYGYMVSVRSARSRDAASMAFVIWHGGFSVTIGKNTVLEFDCRGEKATDCFRSLREVCEAVAAGRFEETVLERTRGRYQGRIVASSAILQLPDEAVRMKTNFPSIKWGTRDRRISYEPY